MGFSKGETRMGVFKVGPQKRSPMWLAPMGSTKEFPKVEFSKWGPPSVVQQAGSPKGGSKRVSFKGIPPWWFPKGAVPKVCSQGVSPILVHQCFPQLGLQCCPQRGDPVGPQMWSPLVDSPLGTPLGGPPVGNAPWGHPLRDPPWGNTLWYPPWGTPLAGLSFVDPLGKPPLGDTPWGTHLGGTHMGVLSWGTLICATLRGSPLLDTL
jgi:hypothetical protein